MRSFGVDLRLELLAEHTPNPSTAGSTLLHRIAARTYRPERNKLACARVLAECVQSYPDLLCQDHIGRTALDWASIEGQESFSDLIHSIIAVREEQALLQSIAPSRPSKRGQVRI
jgi:ankyrin repeat protein